MFLAISSLQWVILGAFLATLMPITIGIIKYRALSLELRSIFWFCVMVFIMDGIGRILWLSSISNLFLGHIHTIAEFLLLANAYRIALRGFVKPLLIPAIMVLFTLLAVCNTLFLQGFKFNNSNIKIIESVLLIAFTLVFFYKLGRDLIVARLEKYPMFWVNCAVLVYFSSSLFIFLYSNYILLYSKQLGIRAWFVHALFFILFNAILSLSLWIVPKNSSLRG